MAREDGAAVPTATAPPPTPAAKLPGYVRFPLLIVLSFTTSMSLLSAASEFMDPQLRAVCHSSNEDAKVISSIAWKLTELSLGWFGNFDDIDLVSLSVLTHTPWYYLLYTFYGVEPTTVVICLVIDALSLAGPTRLLRARAPAHNPRAPRAAVPNRAIISDAQTVLATSLLGAAVYGVSLFAAFQTFLPAFMVVHFDNLPSLAAAHAANLPLLVATLLPVGFAAREFVLVPSLAAQSSRADAERKAFNPETAGLREHVVYNLWWFSKGTRVLVKRTAALVALTFAHSWSHAGTVLEGADEVGAAGYSGVWAVAATLTGLVYAWVENV
ncbi:hypothetical protein B0J12DRAFT_741418 [Macrophomina phaseolina]|uniref:Uncharacterized protein n=1 Tax=Macrophomina phaseolina TaxID=35725 RepID=A0ABQ8GAH0_9PEZI|nr:hypothetical protein B0J12DRAFT_741418 [Macrophomina phaseolina]